METKSTLGHEIFDARVAASPMWVTPKMDLVSDSGEVTTLGCSRTSAMPGLWNTHGWDAQGLDE